MISRLLADAIFALRPKRDPDFLIGEDPADPYMRRWWIIPRNKFFNIYMHHMLHDDDDRAPHDHPWWSLSLCLRGQIKEHRMFQPGMRAPMNYRRSWWKFWTRFKSVVWGEPQTIVKGDWKFRDQNYIHRLELPLGDAWTLFLTGPTVRTWGFWCPKGFKPWKEFVDPDNPGAPGGGCGELQ